MISYAKTIPPFQGPLVRVDGEMASELLGRLDARARSEERFEFAHNSTYLPLFGDDLSQE